MLRGRSAKGFSAEDFENPRHWGYLCMFALIVLSTYAQILRVDFYYGIIFSLAGLVIITFLPQARVPRVHLALISISIFACGLAWLPVDWSAIHVPWRTELAQAGIPAGEHLVIQYRHSLESALVLVVAILVGLILSCYRATNQQLKLWTLLFSLSVAVFAILSQVFREQLLTLTPIKDQFGFFSNRNHTGTFLAMGGLVGLGSAVQAVKDKRMYAVFLSLIASALCYYALIAWSISRGGLLVAAIGLVAWLLILGFSGGLRKDVKRIIGCVILLLVGAFFLADSKVKDRLTVTSDTALTSYTEGTVNDSSLKKVDFRWAIWKDTVGMIEQSPWCGFGAGQFSYIFPFYQNQSLSSNNSDCLHPESDWLWLAAEIGVPGTLAILVLVIYATTIAAIKIKKSRSSILRWSCLIAALMVAVHGIIDVPGHAKPIIWSAAFLYSLSFPFSESGRIQRKIAIGYRLPGVAVLGVGLFFLISALGITSPTALTISEITFSKVKELFQLELAQQKLSSEERSSQKTPDYLELAIDELDKDLLLVPMDWTAYLAKGSAQLNFIEYSPLADKTFSSFLELKPHWLKGPQYVIESYLKQGTISDDDETRVRDLVNLLYKRADYLDSLFGTSLSYRKQADAQMKFMKAKYKALSFLPESSTDLDSK